MQEKIPVANNTAMPIYVAGVMIPAGETRHFDADQVPPHLRPAPAVEVEPETQYDVIAELAGKSVKLITEAIPDLSDEDLARLGEIEQAKGGAARKGVLSAVAEAILSRAEAKAAADAGGAAGTEGTGEV